MAGSNFDKCIEQLDRISAMLDQINRDADGLSSAFDRLPSKSFVIFWLGVFPCLALASIIIGARLAGQ